MAPRLWTAEQLIKYVRDHANVPDTGALGTRDSDIVDYLNEALYDELVPSIMDKREDFFVVSERQSVASGQHRYRIPSRAMGNRLKDVDLIDGTQRIPLNLLTRGDRAYYGPDSLTYPAGFFLENNDIVLVPDTATPANTSLEIGYFFRPGEIVESGSYAVVDTVDLDTKTITLTTTAPSAWTASDLLDIHSYQSGAEIKGWDLALSSISGDRLTLVFTSSIDDSTVGRKDVEVGDYVCLAGEAALPGIPTASHQMLAQVVVAKLLEDQGDESGLKLAAAKLNRQMKHLNTIVGGDGRVESSPRKVKARNSPYSARRRRWNWTSGY